MLCVDTEAAVDLGHCCALADLEHGPAGAVSVRTCEPGRHEFTLPMACRRCGCRWWATYRYELGVGDVTLFPDAAAGTG